ncbi:DNA-binding MarR family transcriptional regulator [Pseudarthrobacter sp. PvP004]|uniref:transcriptional regulator n=1 Tax=Pseudarthrobacter sp. PvP004 TaxID=2817850 RepID=UPI001AE194B5|nr:transcriptional regulator [Pseudarthrobacter sp. PvP004]MBP2269155.1 DNA-binding MarR family transcriptional regulator [Pseudarthrobacter sp. PvP004]
MSHPRKALDALIHSPVRFSLLAALRNLEEADFRFLADLLEVSDSTLSQALSVLLDAGMIEIRKEAAGRRTRTWVAITPAGRDSFLQHLKVLQEIVSSNIAPDAEESEISRKDDFEG